MNAIRKLLNRPSGPRLSLVLVVYDMVEQARRTLRSLAVPYQRGVDASEYEIIVMENASANLLGEAAALAEGDNIRYFLREETLPSPVPSARIGVSNARGDWLALIIDGARMASPGLVRTLLEAGRLGPDTVIAVPGYHLGRVVQQEALKDGYDAAEENRLLESIGWPGDGYRLFDIACFSRSNAAGFFRPNAESNCLCLSRALWDEVGGYDPRFTETGGGQANPDLYKRVCEWPGIRLVITPGEGTFHQFHGGVTTGTAGAEREKHMENHFAQYRALRGESYKAPLTRASLFGEVPRPAMRFLQFSLDQAVRDESGQQA